VRISDSPLGKKDYGRFSVSFDVIFDMGRDEFCIAVVSVDTASPTSGKVPDLNLPSEWRASDHWDWAEAAGAHVGTVYKVG
jgi:hypothetical protein